MSNPTLENDPMGNPYEPTRGPLHAEEPVKRNGKATASLVLGLISIVTWFIPLFGLPTTIVGLVLGIKGPGPQRSGKAIAGIVLSIIFLVITVVNATLGAILVAQGKHPLFPSSP
jgi:hypothetical protein